MKKGSNNKYSTSQINEVKEVVKKMHEQHKKGSLCLYYKKMSVSVPIEFEENVLVPFFHKNKGQHLKVENQKHYFWQLDKMISNWSSITTEDSKLFALNVFVLTTLGLIENDEYNGLLYMVMS